MEKIEVPSAYTTCGAFRSVPAWQAAADGREDATFDRYRRQHELARDTLGPLAPADAMAHLEFSLRLGR